MTRLWFFKKRFFPAELSVKSGRELATTRDLAAGSEECGRVSAQREVGEMAAGGRRRQQAQAFSVQVWAPKNI
jgi:hypothetical protein